MGERLGTLNCVMLLVVGSSHEETQAAMYLQSASRVLVSNALVIDHRQREEIVLVKCMRRGVWSMDEGVQEEVDLTS